MISFCTWDNFEDSDNDDVFNTSCTGNSLIFDIP